MRKLALLLALMMAIPAFVLGENSSLKVIYVSPDGNDLADGVTAPVATPARAIALAGEWIHEGDVTIDLANGTYEVAEALVLDGSNTDGANGHTLTFRGHGESYISGGQTVTDWTQESEKVWSAKVPDDQYVYGLFVDGKIMDIASQTLYGSFYDANGKGGIVKKYGERYASFSAYGNVNEPITELYFTSLRFKKATLEDMQADLKNIRFRFNQTFMSACFTIDEITKGKDEGVYTLKFTQDTLDLINKTHMQDFDGSMDKNFLFGSRLFLDRESEYCFDEDTHTVYLCTEEDPNEKECVIPIAEHLVVIEGTEKGLASGVRFENVGFCYCADIYTMNHVCQEQYADAYAFLFTEEDGREARIPERYYGFGGVYLRFASNVRFDHCDFVSMSMIALRLDEYVYNVTVDSCRFEDLGGSGLNVGHPNPLTGLGWEDIYGQPEDLENVYSFKAKKTGAMPGLITVNNCSFIDTGLRNLASPALTIYYASYATLTHNTVVNAAGCGFSLGTGCNNMSVSNRGVKYNGPFTVQYNFISGSNRTADDAGGIYTCGFMGEGSVISDNFVNMKGSVRKNNPAIYLDEGSEYLTVTNNLCVNTRHWLSCRALPVAYEGGRCVAGKKLEKNTIMNCTVTGNFADQVDQGQDYAPGIAWPSGAEVQGANVTINAAYVDAEWKNDLTMSAIRANAGCNDDVGMRR